MKVFFAFLMMFVIAFQLFFRYDYWNSKQDDGVVYERDKLTGEVHIIRPGERIDFLSRTVGKHIGTSLDSRHPAREKETSRKETSPSHTPSALDTEEVDDSEAQASVPIPDAPQTMAMVDEASLTAEHSPPIAVASATPAEPKRVAKEGYALNKTLDLNKDGTLEKLIKTAEPGGDTSISIVTESGREIFFARGKGIHVLATRMDGWPDLALRQPGQSQQFYRYNPKAERYETIHYQ